MTRRLVVLAAAACDAVPVEAGVEAWAAGHHQRVSRDVEQPAVARLRGGVEKTLVRGGVEEEVVVVMGQAPVEGLHAARGGKILVGPAQTHASGL